MISILKTTVLLEDAQSVTIRLDGNLGEPTANSLLKICRRYQIEKKTIVLDLAGLSFIDEFGLEALARIQTRGMQTINASVFISSIIAALDTNHINGNSVPETIKTSDDCSD